MKIAASVLFSLVLLPLLAQETEPYKRTFHFELKAPEASSVVLSGKTAGSSAVEIPLRKTRGGDWFVNAELPLGRLEYVFLIDGRPVLDDQSPSEDDGKGAKRSFFVIDDDRDAQPSEVGPRGSLELHRVKSKALEKEVPVNLYVPAGYSPKYGYPVLVLLHGFGMDENQWVTGGIVNYLDRFILSGKLQPVIVAMPGVPSEFYRGKTEVFITRELLPWLRKNYSTVKGPGQTAVGGMSMGGFGAFYLAYRHPDVFGHAMVLSPGLRDSDFLDQLDAELKSGKKVKVSLDIRCGKGDNLVMPFTERLESILSANKIPHRYEITRGVHDWDYWRSVLEPALLEVNKALKRPAP